MLRIDAYASRPHYADHIRPVWEALPAARRGVFGAPRGSPWGARLDADHRAGPIIVASAVDAQAWPHRPRVLVDHGAGQTYGGDPRMARNMSYSGGDGLDLVEVFLCPNVHVADNWQARYGDARAPVVGCPKLDVLHRRFSIERWVMPRQPVVAMTFHWDCPTIPETTSAVSHYVRGLRPLAQALGAAGASLVGHAHPRAAGRLRDMWAAVGVPYWPTDDVVLASADVLVADNTSLLYEFASLGKPVVVLNAPWYRRNVEHGLRFWSHVPGVQIDEPADLLDAITHVIEQPAAERALRSRAVERVYSHTNGTASLRAASAILDWLDNGA